MAAIDDKIHVSNVLLCCRRIVILSNSALLLDNARLANRLAEEVSNLNRHLDRMEKMDVSADQTRLDVAVNIAIAMAQSILALSISDGSEVISVSLYVAVKA